MSIVSSYPGTGNRKGTNPGRGYPGVLANCAGSLLAVMLFLVFADGSHAVEPVYSFDIPRQTADGALTALGEQADISVLYQYELVVLHETNQLRGRYTLEQAITALLSNSGLKAEFGTAGHLIIHADGEQNAMIEQTNEWMPNASSGKTTTRKPLLKRLGTAIAAALFATSGAGAIAAPGDTNETEIEEIIVTATYRETDLMDTPQSIGTLSSEMIEALGATDMRGLFQNITGLNMSEREIAGGNRYTIRGVSSPTGHEPSAQTSAAVSVYLDDVPMTSAQSPVQQFGGNMFDMERVEVLKGPQGTLYGEGSVGGTIRFIQKKPQLGETTWKIKGNTSSMSSSDDLGHRLDGVVNLPVTEDFAIRLMGFSTKRQGWIDKTDTGEKDANSETGSGGRLAALWAVNRDLSVEANYYKTELETEGSMAAQSRFTEALNVRLPGRRPFSKDKVNIYSLGVDYAFDFAKLELAFSNLDRKRTSEIESTTTIAAFIDSFVQLRTLIRAPANPTEIPTLLAEGWILAPTFSLPIKNLAGFNLNDMMSSDRNTVEARLVSTTESALVWTAGLFWKDSNDDRVSIQPLSLIPSLIGKPAITALYTEAFTNPANSHFDEVNQISVFGEATFAFSDTFSVTLGGRYTDLDQSLQGSAATTTDKVFSPKLGVAWYPVDGTLTYFNITTGFRPGNLNVGQESNAHIFRGAGDNVIPATPFAPNPNNLTGNQAADLATSLVSYQGDKVVNYEVGIKTRLFDDRWNLTTAVYYFDWKDTILRFSQNGLPAISRTYNDNAGAAHSVGIEVDLVGNLMENLRMTLGGDINRAELDEAVGAIPSGTKLPNAPEWSAHITLDYTWLFAGDMALNFMVNHTTLAGTVSSLAIAPSVVPSRRLTDIRILLSGSDANWSASLFATNVTNQDEITFDCGSPGFPTCLGFQQPRVIGLEVTLQR